MLLTAKIDDVSRAIPLRHLSKIFPCRECTLEFKKLLSKIEIAAGKATKEDICKGLENKIGKMGIEVSNFFLLIIFILY